MGRPDEGTLTPPMAWQRLLRSSAERAWSELPPTFPESEMLIMLHESLANRDQLIVHLGGYPATLAMLDAMDSTGGPAVWLDKRVRFEHGDAIFRDLVPQLEFR